MTAFAADRDRRLRVLFVEDSEDDVVLLLRHLEKNGFDPDHRRVETAEGLERALQTQSWDLILADYNLPRFGAPAALELVREAGFDVPFIVVSGTIGEETAVDLMRAGAHDFILKDHLTRLVPAIERELREARERERRRRAEDEVRSANARLRRLVSGSPVVIYSSAAAPDADTRFVSRNVEEQFGHSPAEFLEDPDFWVNHLHPDGREQVVERYRAAVEAGGGELEYRFRDANGRYRWIRDGFDVLEWEGEQEPDEIVGYVLDVTEEKKARDRLEESEARFRQIAEHIDEVFWMTTPDKGQMLYLSPAYEKVTGRPRGDVYDDWSAWLEAVHPEDRERVRAEVPRQVEGDFDVEYRVVRPDGEIRWIRDRAFPVLDDEDEVSRIVGVAQDVTERKEARTALEGMQRYYRALMEQAGDTILVVEPDGTIRHASAAFQALLGIDPSEAHGRDGLESVHPADRERVGQRLEEVAAEPGSQTRASYRVVRPDGETRHVEAVARNLLEEPAVRGIVVNIRDVTDRVELEEQLRQSQKMEAVGRLAGGVAHDFNNILTVVEGHADLLLEDLPVGSGLREDAEEIGRAADRASGLTRQLLAFARRQVLEFRTVDLNATVRDVLEMLGRVLGEDVRIELDLAGEPLPVRVDPVQLEQVVLNLAVNAREAMPEGGRVTVRSRAEADCGNGVDEGDEGEPDCCVLEVEDTGPGIPEEVREQIFEPFFSTKESGSGLGLSMVYGIVTQSGGSIDVRSEESEGSTFVIRLPTGDSRELEAEGTDEEAGDPPGEAAAPTRPGTVLVVEDDGSLRPLIRRILERWDFPVAVTSTPDEALEILERDGEGVELLLTDVMLPSMSGPELARRALELQPDLRFLLISGYSDDAVAWEELPRERRNFLSKPFTPDQLVDRVRQVLGRAGEAGGEE